MKPCGRGASCPRAVDIDEVTTDHPVFLVRIDGHVAVANTAGAENRASDARHKNPQGGEIARDASGEPNGILRETAQSVVASLIPPPTPEKHREAIEAALQDIARSGVTSAQDFSGDNGESSRANFKILEQLEREGKLTVRISEWLPFNEPVESLKQMRDSHPQADPMLHTGMLKAFMDGSLGSHTSAMLAPFTDDPKNSGLPQYEQSKLNRDGEGTSAKPDSSWDFMPSGTTPSKWRWTRSPRQRRRARADGVKAPDGSDNFRLRVEHAQVTNPAQVERFRELNVIASMQPSHLLTDMHWAMSRLGPQRAAHSYAWAEFENHGVRLAFGTDYPVEPVAPFRGIYAAVTRKSEDGKQEYFPEQKLTIQQAIAAYTTGSAYAEFAEKEKGTLAPGMLADFVVLDRDLTAIPPDNILGARVLQTVMGGKTVFEGN